MIYMYTGVTVAPQEKRVDHDILDSFGGFKHNEEAVSREGIVAHSDFIK